MFQLVKRFIHDERGQDFAEYALILGAVGVVEIAAIAHYKTELLAGFEDGICIKAVDADGCMFCLSRLLQPSSFHQPLTRFIRFEIVDYR
jgi:Flp pilus assembly pilin Flp